MRACTLRALRTIGQSPLCLLLRATALARLRAHTGLPAFARLFLSLCYFLSLGGILPLWQSLNKTGTSGAVLAGFKKYERYEVSFISWG